MKIDSNYEQKNIFNQLNKTPVPQGIKFNNIFSALLAETDENTGEEELSTNKSTNDSIFNEARMFTPPPPPPPGEEVLDLSTLIAIALENGDITAEKAAEYQELLVELKEENIDPGQMAQIFNILQSYLTFPSIETAEETSIDSVIGIPPVNRAELESQRLADLEAAIEAAKEAGDLSDEQYTLISEFITAQRNFQTMMADLRPEESEETIS